MYCIFCKKDSSSSASVEHIIPESLGNTKNILPKGIVCDDCNNYFSRKIEGPLLEQRFFKNLRGRNWIKSKKGKIPPENLQDASRESNITLYRNEKEKIPMILSFEDYNFAKSIFNGKSDKFVLPFEIYPPENNNRIIARFLGKVGIEAIAQSFYPHEGGIEYLTNHEQIDLLRNFVRFNVSKEEWKYTTRRIYGENEKFFYKTNPDVPTDVVYEFGIFTTKHSEYYICVIVKGYEFVLNLGGPPVDGYKRWLVENNNVSPLYSEEYSHRIEVLPWSGLLPGKK